MKIRTLAPIIALGLLSACSGGGASSGSPSSAMPTVPQITSAQGSSETTNRGTTSVFAVANQLGPQTFTLPPYQVPDAGPSGLYDITVTLNDVNNIAPGTTIAVTPDNRGVNGELANVTVVASNDIPNSRYVGLTFTAPNVATFSKVIAPLEEYIDIGCAGVLYFGSDFSVSGSTVNYIAELPTGLRLLKNTPYTFIANFHYGTPF